MKASVGNIAIDFGSSGGSSFNGGTITNPLVISGTSNATDLTISGSTRTSTDAHPFLSISGTWNTSGNPTAILLNVTNTASGNSSLLLDLQLGGNSFASISKYGFLILGPASGSQLSSLMQINGQFGQVNLTQGGNANIVCNVSLGTQSFLEAEYGASQVEYIGAHPVSSFINLGSLYGFGVCTDAISTTNIGAGGGSVKVPVFYNGASWTLINGLTDDTGWGTDGDNGDKTVAIGSSTSMATLQAALNTLAAGSGDALVAVSKVVKALKTALNAGLLPNAN